LLPSKVKLRNRPVVIIRNVTIILVCLLGLSQVANTQTCKGPLDVTITGATSQVPIDVDESTSDVYCTQSSEGAISLEVMGGTPAYTCQWSHDTTSTDFVSNLTPGLYSVTVTDANGCTKDKNILIDHMDPLADSLTLVDHTACGNCYLFDDTQSFFYEDDQYIGAVIDIETDLDLGNTQVCADVNNDPGELYGDPVLPRCWTILTDSVENANFRLFFTIEELDKLAYEVGEDSGEDLVYNNSLIVNVYPLADFHANTPSEYELYPEEFTITLYDEKNGVWSLELFDIENSKIRLLARQGVLPVELLAFNGEARKDHNHLTWETGSEVNTKGFHLERSENGLVFEDITFLPAGGRIYSFDDNDPIIGENYYRLRIEDIDGSVDYSHIIRLKQEGPFSFKLLNNPVTQILFIETESTHDTDINVSVIGINGQVLSISDHQVLGGVYKVELDLEYLLSGNYIIKVTEKKSRYTDSKKIVKI